MVEAEVSFTSLCCIEEGYDGRVWLHRLADIENGILHMPFKSGREDNYFENRDRLYRNDGPSRLGTVGIWDWTAIPNRDNPAIDYVQSHYVKDCSPIRVVVLTVNSLEDVVAQLRGGTARTLAYFCDTFFCYELNAGQLVGVLLYANEFNISNQYAKLSNEICSLPCYTISTSNIYNWNDRNLRFLNVLQIGSPSEYILTGNTDDMIRALILKRITWPLFKEWGATKAEWRNSKELLEKIWDGSFYERESLYEEIVQEMKCTPEQAKQAVHGFVERAGGLMEAGDIDADVLAQIALHHDELRIKCEEIVSKKWQETHAVEIAAAEQRIIDAEIAVSAAEEKRNDLLSEITAAQSRRDQLLTEIEQYEALGRDTLVAVRQKISDAQKDMAGFIADVSVFLPQPSVTFPHTDQSVPWQYVSAAEERYLDDDIEPAESWRNEFDAIHQNLSHTLCAEPDFCAMLTAFLYSTHINNTPILIAGPGGWDIAEALSVSMYATGAGQLILGDECNLSIAERISEADDSIVSVQNMFGKGWADTLPQKFTRLKKQIIWTHPYVEDMLVEPKGLYNYMLPILSECFIGAFPASKLWPGKRIAEFKPYISQGEHPLRISAFKHLGISKLLLNRLTHILSDAKAILDNSAKDKDMEILFGVLPLCVLNGKLDVLKNVIESESGISKSVKDEAARYIEEE